MKKWNFLIPDPASVKSLHNHLKCSPLIATLLVNRGINSPSQADRFFNLSFQNLLQPGAMKDMDSAVFRIYNALVRKERILIFGDYDVDGVTATVLLYEFLTAADANVSYYIPHRETEGYGLQLVHVLDYAVSHKTNLIITVDCGSSSHEAVTEAYRSGIDVIITDHHAISDPIPEALAVINPKRRDCPSGAEYLAGVGVVYFLVISLRKYLREHGFWESRKEPNLKECCDLVALGSIADMVPLTHDNRIFVKHGLDLINSRRRNSIQSLIEISGINPSTANAEDIAFRLAPRLNAAGRMNHADAAVSLLLSRDMQKAREFSETLNTFNTQRQSIEKQIINEILQRFQEHPEDLESKVLFLSNTGWPSGVLGIVASRLLHSFFRPVILISLQNGMGKGSARSIPGFNLYQALSACADCLNRFGGHAAAAGFEIAADRIPEFQSRFSRIADKQIHSGQYTPEIAVDCMLDFKDISDSLINEIELLQPYGTGNPEPVFITHDVQVVSSKIVGGNTHRMILKPRCKTSAPGILAVQFNFDLAEVKKYNGIDSIAYRLRWNYWNGNRTPQILIEDAKFSLQSPMTESIIGKQD